MGHPVPPDPPDLGPCPDCCAHLPDQIWAIYDREGFFDIHHDWHPPVHGEGWLYNYTTCRWYGEIPCDTGGSFHVYAWWCYFRDGTYGLELHSLDSWCRVETGDACPLSGGCTALFIGGDGVATVTITVNATD